MMASNIAKTGRLAGKIIVVTAAAQGIGRSTTKAFSREGATIYASDVNETKLKELEQLPGVFTRVVNVTDRTAIGKLATELPKVDVLFNCAGIVRSGSILDITDEDFKLLFDVNVRSMIYTCQAILPKMKEAKKGSIINMASVSSSILGVPNRCLYTATKGAVIALTKSTAVEFAQDGIRCNCICPGTIHTPSIQARFDSFDNPEEARRTFEARQKMGRLGKPEEIAELAVYLASDESSFTTGQEFRIDGGWSV